MKHELKIEDKYAWKELPVYGKFSIPKNKGKFCIIPRSIYYGKSYSEFLKNCLKEAVSK